jgi:hypothetical protein
MKGGMKGMKAIVPMANDSLPRAGKASYKV